MRALISGLFLVACSTDHQAPPLVCVDAGVDTCKPTYDPQTFATIHAKILKPNCATGTGTCHTSDAAKGNLILDTEQGAYDALLSSRVSPGDTSCSLLMERLLATDSENRMPSGNVPLPAADICTISKWIQQGAKR